MTNITTLVSFVILKYINKSNILIKSSMNIISFEHSMELDIIIIFDKAEKSPSTVVKNISRD